MRCCGCGEEFPDRANPTHAYMLSSPGCWEAYGRVLALEYGNPAYARLHRLAVEAYAVQHPGLDEPRSRNSVGIHLSRLCLIFDRGWPIERANDAMVTITAKKRNYPWLAPPSDRGSVTVRHVLAAVAPAEHLDAVEGWAQAAWQAWAEHHATVRGWLEALK